jgi:hypothetical protein
MGGKRGGRCSCSSGGTGEANGFDAKDATVATFRHVKQATAKALHVSPLRGDLLELPAEEGGGGGEAGSYAG